MKHEVISVGSEWQDPETGERNDDYRDECIYCGQRDANEAEECPGRKEEEDGKD